jgi:hypothetical protein
MRIQNDFFAARHRAPQPASNTMLVSVGLLIGAFAAAVVLLTGLVH